MGVVYLAQDEALLRPTAIKIMSWSFLDSNANRPEAWFLAEARGVASIDHPGVVQVYNVAKHGGYCYVAMEYVEGVSGDMLVSTRGPLPAIEATQIILQIAGALEHAHGRNIIHRDVKPANVLVRKDGTAKLGDFGMALHAASVDPGMHATVGTPHYIAPETWRGSPANRLSDIYALGATYFYFLTGRPPFDAKDVRALIEEHERLPVPDPASFEPGLSPDCGRIIRKCMAKKSSDRYSSCQELSWDLRGILRRLNCSNLVKTAEGPAADSIDEWSIGHRTLPGPLEPWAGALGFRRRPFAAISPLGCPYESEPILGLRSQLTAFLNTESGDTLILKGANGSGRTMLTLRCMADLPNNAYAAYMDLKYGEEPLAQELGLSQWACRALGALPSTSARSDRNLEGLLEHLAEKSKSALLVFDSVPARPQLIEELSSLVRAARSTGYMRLVIVGSQGVDEQVARRLGEEGRMMRMLTVPPLEPRQTADYLASWITSARNPRAAPVIFTLDAAFLIHHRTSGNLARINSLACNMLQVAAQQKRRLLPSWLAWLALDVDGQLPDGALAVKEPEDWPTPEVLNILNSYRLRFGLPERQEETKNAEP
jgi:type II secretory pathway predicted ATPase ExeA